MKKLFTILMITMPFFSQAEINNSTKTDINNNPQYVRFLLMHINDKNSIEYQHIQTAVQSTASAIDYFTKSSLKNNQRLDFCLPNHLETYQEYGNIYNQIGNTEKVIELILRETKRDPERYNPQFTGMTLTGTLINGLRSEYPCPIQVQKRY